MQRRFSELQKYILAGLINTMVGYGVFLIVFRGMGLPPEIANAWGYALALGVAFLLNHYFVFAGSGSRAARSMIRFIVSFGIAFALNQATLFLMLKLFMAEIAQILAMTVYTFSNYLLNKHFAFRAEQLPPHT